MRIRPTKTRREILKLCGRGLAAPPLSLIANCVNANSQSYSPPTGPAFEGTDAQLLDEIQRASFEFCWNEASAATGQVKDRARAEGQDSHTMSSIAATGFGLTSLCIGHIRGHHKSSEIT